MPDHDDSMNHDEPVITGPGFPVSFSGQTDGVISAREFEQSFGEEIRTTLDLASWRTGSDLEQEYRRLEEEVRDAVERETQLQEDIRRQIFPSIKTRPSAPKNAGVHTADQKLIERIHKDLLFHGGMEACDGAIQIHQTLPLTIFQIGVTLVSYQGDQGTWSQRLFRRDLHQSFANRLDAVLATLQQRAQRSGEGGDRLSELVQKAMLDYAERAFLLRRSKALWRMGHGNPVTFELLTGGGSLELMVEATNTIREFVEVQQKFVFVAHEPREEMLLTIGHALRPLEFAIVQTLDERLEQWLHHKRFTTESTSGLNWDGESISAAEWMPRFIERVASKIAVCLFRATPIAPALVFYAHVDHADYAAHMVLADSVLQEQRGFPMLADMARNVCSTVFADSLSGLAENAYAATGVPWRYVPTRTTR